MRMCHGPPGVSCSPWMNPLFSQRYSVTRETPSSFSAWVMETTSSSSLVGVTASGGL